MSIAQLEGLEAKESKVIQVTMTAERRNMSTADTGLLRVLDTERYSEPCYRKMQWPKVLVNASSTWAGKKKIVT